jgi:hypothetical protein
MTDFTGCQFLSSIPRKAVFVLSPDRNDSQTELLTFSSGQYDNDKGVCLMLWNSECQSVCGGIFDGDMSNCCDRLTEKKFDSTKYFVCDYKDFEECRQDHSGCPFTKLIPIASGELENIIMSGFMEIVISYPTNVNEILCKELSS